MEQKESIELKNYNSLAINEKIKVSMSIECSKKKFSLFFYCITLILFIITFLYTLNIRHSLIKKYKEYNSYAEKLKIMTNYNELKYEGIKKCLFNQTDEDMCIYRYLCPKKVKGKKRVLIGKKEDGCYVMLNDFENIKIAYSIGIRDLIQFDKDLADKGIDVYMYDHTINKLPYENKYFHWKKIGIGGNSERKYNIQTIEDMIKNNRHKKEKNMILKMDIESAEWNALNDISENILNQFKYILIEFHFSDGEPKLYYNILRKLYKTHQPFYAHCSPFSNIKIFGNNIICGALEVSYIIRKGNIFTEDETIYPVPEFSYGFKPDFNINILKLFNDNNI